jgi:hypothetical protein
MKDPMALMADFFLFSAEPHFACSMRSDEPLRLLNHVTGCRQTVLQRSLFALLDVSCGGIETYGLDFVMLLNTLSKDTGSVSFGFS